MIQRVVTGSSRLNNQVPTGTPTSAPLTMTAVALRSACRHAPGMSGAAATKSMIRSSAAIKRGEARLLASGMKISAEPNPEKPRAVAEMKAIAEIPSAALRLTSGGMKVESVMLSGYEAGRDKRQASRMAASRPQNSAGLFYHFGNDLCCHRIDFLIGHSPLTRLHGDGDRDRLLGLLDAFSLIDVEHGDLGNQLLVGALGRAHDVAGPHLAIDDEGEIARDRLERREFQQWFGAGRLLPCCRYPVEDHLECHQRAVGAQSLEDARMQLTEMAENVLRADLDGGRTPRMQPVWATGYDLQRLHGCTGGLQHRERISLGIERVRLR